MKQYKVTKEFMDELVAWRDKKCLDVTLGQGFVYSSDLDKVPPVVKSWWLYDNTSPERNSRLIAIISWLNGEDVFEVEEPRYAVRSASADESGAYAYVYIFRGGLTGYVYSYTDATKFDTYEEAKEWANSHQVVVEIDEDGKEI